MKAEKVSVVTIEMTYQEAEKLASFLRGNIDHDLYDDSQTRQQIEMKVAEKLSNTLSDLIHSI